MLDRWKAAYRRWKNLREVKTLEKIIQSLIPRYRYDLETPYRKLHFTLVRTPTQEAGTVLTADLKTRGIEIHSDAAPCDVRLALGMLLVHLSVTYPGRWAMRPPYIVYAYDLVQKDGPTHNEQWLEYMQALDLLLPRATYEKLAAIQPGRASYVIQRVMNVTHGTIEQRTRAFVHNADPVYQTEVDRFLAQTSPQPD